MQLITALRIPAVSTQDSFDAYQTHTPQDEYDYSSDSDIDDEELDPDQELERQSASRDLENCIVPVCKPALSVCSDDLDFEAFTSVGQVLRAFLIFSLLTPSYRSIDDDEQRGPPDCPSVGLEVLPRVARRGEVVRVTRHAYRT